MKKFSLVKNKLFQTLLVTGAIALQSHAAVQVVDPDDSVILITNHLGEDAFDLASGFGLSLGILFVDRVDARVAADNDSNIFFTSGSSIVPANLFSSNIVYAGGVFSAGASSGVNYARLDLDANGVYETVFEFDFGPNAIPTDDVFTRYAYDDTGASLDIPEAIVAFNSIPEPSSLFLSFIGFAALLRCRR